MLLVVSFDDRTARLVLRIDFAKVVSLSLEYQHTLVVHGYCNQHKDICQPFSEIECMGVARVFPDNVAWFGGLQDLYIGSIFLIFSFFAWHFHVGLEIFNFSEFELGKLRLKGDIKRLNPLKVLELIFLTFFEEILDFDVNLFIDVSKLFKRLIFNIFSIQPIKDGPSLFQKLNNVMLVETKMDVYHLKLFLLLTGNLSLEFLIFLLWHS